MTNDRATKKAEELLKQTKEKFLASADPYQTLQDLLAAELREYGAQVREEAAKIAKQSNFEDGSKGTIEGQIAAAIRKMELP